MAIIWQNAAHPATDGAGVKIMRNSIRPQYFDPFLLLDELKSDDRADFIGGFPPHPHRGIETLSYLMVGGIEHRDSIGNVRTLTGGGAQWMSTGKGIVHAEMPLTDSNQLHGFQLWLNLPAAQKMKEPEYQDVTLSELGQYQQQHVSVLAIAGCVQIDELLCQGPIRTTVKAAVADLRLSAGQTLVHLPENWRGYGYVYQGILNQSLVTGTLFAYDSDVVLSADGDCGVLLMQGLPLDEPVVQYGPFVMNTEAQIKQAISEYNAGIFPGQG